MLLCHPVLETMSKRIPSDTLECRIAGAYHQLECAPGNDGCERFVVIERVGRYEIRLVDAWALLPDEKIPFWIELYDGTTETSLDSFTSPDVKKTAAAAEAMIAAAKRLQEWLARPEDKQN
jgi:hypothetical protein